jgi:Na+/melibiose symporter-like transporter
VNSAIPPTTPRRPGAFAVRDFRFLWSAGFVSDAGDWLLFIALPLVVLRLTGSAFGTSVALLLTLAPLVLLAPLFSRVVSRFDTRRLMIIANLLQGLALIPLALVHSAAQLPLLYGVIAVESALSGIFDPAKNALLPRLVGESQLVSANALVGLNENLARLVGGSLGGLILAFGGASAVVLADAFTYVVSAVLIFAMRSNSRVITKQLPVDSMPASTGGLIAALRIRGLRGTYIVLFLTGVSQGLFAVLFVLFVVRQLHGSDSEVGLFRGIQAIGSIAAGLVLGLFVKSVSTRVLIGLSLLVFGCLSLVVWNLSLVTTETSWYVGLFIVLGAPGVFVTTGLVTAFQTGTQDAQRGAAFAAFSLIWALGQATGMLAAGLLGNSRLMPVLEAQGALYVTSGVVALIILQRPAPKSRSDNTEKSTV